MGEVYSQQFGVWKLKTEELPLKLSTLDCGLSTEKAQPRQCIATEMTFDTPGSSIVTP
jgi:hypothetical protein